MSSPQVENGYTMIANELLEAISRKLLSGDEHRIFWTILRKTYGFKKKIDQISLSQFVLATGINKQNVCRALSKLIKKNMIIRTDNKSIRSYSIQKDYTIWKPLSKQITLSKQIKSVIQIDNKSLSKQSTTKERDTKETITKEKRIDFDDENYVFLNIQEKDREVWKDAYPGCNIDQELKKMISWLLGDWPRRKKINYKRFITNWLSRTQDKGGSKTTTSDEMDAWAKRQAEKEKK